ESILKNTVAKIPDSWKNFGPSSLAASRLPNQTNASTRAYKGLEQLVLKNLVENMLPKDSPALFGSSTAGDIWRSMLADQLASEMGSTVDLGSARRQTIGIHSAARPGDAVTVLLHPLSTAACATTLDARCRSQHPKLSTKNNFLCLEKPTAVFHS